MLVSPSCAQHALRSLLTLKMLCIPFDRSRSIGWWHGKTQITHNSWRIIKIMIVVTPNGRDLWLEQSVYKYNFQTFRVSLSLARSLARSLVCLLKRSALLCLKFCFLIVGLHSSLMKTTPQLCSRVSFWKNRKCADMLLVLLVLSCARGDHDWITERIVCFDRGKTVSLR